MVLKVQICVLAIALCMHCSAHAWVFGGDGGSKGSSSSDRGVIDRVVGAVKDAGRFVGGAVRGTVDMGRAYKDMRDANFKNSDKYFHARGNYDAAKHGAGGKWAAKVISDTREALQGGGPDSEADQRANKWGRGGGNPNKYRPEGLPSKYRK